MITDLANLQPGTPAFVEIYGGVYKATVHRQLPHERVVQVQTPAARLIMAPWLHMSFRYSDGRADALRDHARLIVPDTDEELEHWQMRLRKTAFTGELALDLSGPVNQ